MAFVAALMIPGGMPIWQAHTEFCDRSSIYKPIVIDILTPSDTPLRDFRMNCLVGSAFSALLQLVYAAYAIGMKSMVLLSNAFLVGAALCVALVIVNACLLLFCSDETNRFAFERPEPYNPSI